MKRILTAFLLFASLFLAACQDSAGPQNDTAQPDQEQANHRKKKSRSARENAGNDNVAPDRTNPGPVEDNPRGGENDVIDRHANRLIYTKHARCRMDCRHIDESEVQEILQQGRINYRKSEPAGRPDPKYALEGTTHDGQTVRIVFAPAKRGMVVITVIDLDTDWTCDCF